MILEKLQMQNYGPFRGACTLDLSPRGPVGDAPICLIGALNGSGKTSVLDAISLALHGPRARVPARGSLGWRDFLCAARHADAPKDEESLLVLTFTEHTDGVARRYCVRRAWHLTNTSASDSLRVNVNGGYSEEETELWAERAEEILPVGLTSLFFFDGEQVRALATAEHPPSEVQGAIRTLLGLDLAERLSRDLGAIASRRRKHLVPSELIASVERLKRSLAELDQELRRSQSELQDAEARRLVLREALQAQARESAHPPRSPANVPENDDHEGAAISDEERIDRGRRELIDLCAGVLPLALVGPLLQRTLARAGAEVQRQRQVLAARDLELRDQDLLDWARRWTSPSQLSELRDWLSQSRAQRADPLTPEPYLQCSQDLLSVAAHLAEVQLPEAAQRARGSLEEVRRARRGQEIERLKRRRQQEVQARDVQADEQFAALAAEEARVAALSQRTLELEQRHQQLNLELSRHLRELTDARLRELESRRVVEASERVVGVMDRYRDILIRRRITELEDLTTQRLRYLLHKPDFVAQVQIAPSTFAISLRTEQGRAIDRARLSAGEQQILAIAFLWALSEATGRDLPVVIDTPLGRMDSEHRANLVDRYLPEASHQVIVLSTDTEIDRPAFERLRTAGRVDRCWTLHHEPTERRSSIREGYFWETT